jgi:methylmalonyl-CoA mutase cobalamin-binding domain/chain
MGEPDLTELGKALADLQENLVERLVAREIEKKRPPLEIINELSSGMDAVGSRYKQGEYYLTELLFSGEIFQSAMSRLKPLVAASGGRQFTGKLIMGTVKGDIHDLGKNIVVMLLECAGFEVIDLGVDVAPETFVKALQDSQVPLIGLSSLISTGFDSMKETIAAITQAGLRPSVKIMIGGGPTSEGVKNYAGADFYGPNAAAAVDIARSVLTGSASR